MKRLALTSFDELSPYMDVVQPRLIEACSYSGGRYSPEHLVESLQNNSMQIWLAFDGDDLNGFLLSQILEYPKARTLRFFCCMGVKIGGWQVFMTEIGGWLPFMAEAEEWGKHQGCSLSQIEAPQGWGLLIKNLGYNPTHVLFEKGLR